MRGTQRARGTHSRAARWLRLLALVLSVFVALGASMPAYARLVAGPQPHVCHCEARGGHAHCACPICFPELRADDDLLAGFGVVKGVCGDDDPAYRPVIDLGVPSATITGALVERIAILLDPSVPDPVSVAPDIDPRPPRTKRG